MTIVRTWRSFMTTLVNFSGSSTSSDLAVMDTISALAPVGRNEDKAYSWKMKPRQATIQEFLWNTFQGKHSFRATRSTKLERWRERELHSKLCLLACYFHSLLILTEHCLLWGKTTFYSCQTTFLFLPRVMCTVVDHQVTSIACVCVRVCICVCPVSNSFLVMPRIRTKVVSVDR